MNLEYIFKIITDKSIKYKLKNLYTYSANLNVLTAPHYSRVGEWRIDQNITKLEHKMIKNSTLEERHHGCSTSSVVHATEQGNIKTSPL